MELILESGILEFIQPREEEIIANYNGLFPKVLNILNLVAILIKQIVFRGANIELCEYLVYPEFQL